MEERGVYRCPLCHVHACKHICTLIVRTEEVSLGEGIRNEITVSGNCDSAVRCCAVFRWKLVLKINHSRLIRQPQGISQWNPSWIGQNRWKPFFKVREGFRALLIVIVTPLQRGDRRRWEFGQTLAAVWTGLQLKKFVTQTGKCENCGKGITFLSEVLFKVSFYTTTAFNKQQQLHSSKPNSISCMHLMFFFQPFHFSSSSTPFNRCANSSLGESRDLFISAPYRFQAVQWGDRQPGSAGRLFCFITASR